MYRLYRLNRWLVGCWCFNLSRKHWLIQADLRNLHHLPLKRRKKTPSFHHWLPARGSPSYFSGKKTPPLVHHVCHKISISPLEVGIENFGLLDLFSWWFLLLSLRIIGPSNRGGLTLYSRVLLDLQANSFEIAWFVGLDLNVPKSHWKTTIWGNVFHGMKITMHQTTIKTGTHLFGVTWSPSASKFTEQKSKVSEWLQKPFTDRLKGGQRYA